MNYEFNLYIYIYIGPMIALRLGCMFVPIRKKGKLPGNTFVAQYKKEYGVDEFEIPADALKENQNVVIVDDLIATGGNYHKLIINKLY